MLPENYGQFIAGIGFSEGSRTFNNQGRAEPSPAYRKIAASGFVEYGYTPWLSLVAAPTLAREGNSAANTVTGSDSSAFGARLRLAESATDVLSIQTLVQPPLAPGDRATQLADGGGRNLAVDIRLMFAHTFSVFGMPTFIEMAPGARVRADPFPSEARLDVTFGIRPVARLLLLAQTFLSSAPSAGSLMSQAGYVATTAYGKLQVSAVYDIGPRWSVQLGVFRTIVGINTVRETGPLGAVWYRF